MIKEQEISYKINLNEIIKLLTLQKDSIQIDNIIINYYGDRTKLKNKNFKANKEELLFINYKELYIGGVSLNDITQREKFGLNKYSENSFYLGQWKHNMKHGTGFLKINENIMYIGSFVKNQIKGFGMLFYKKEELLYFGNFIDGKFSDGLYYNQKIGHFYRGKVKDGKKNDSFCTFFEINKGHLFIGEVIDDIFTKGYLAIYEITKEKITNEKGEEEELISFKIKKILYFDKSDKNKKINTIHFSLFSPDFYEKIEDFMNKVLQADYNLKDQSESIIEYFNGFDNYINDRDYIDYIIKCNQMDDEESLENFFLRDYQEYYETFEKGQEVFDLENYNGICGPPEIIQEI